MDRALENADGSCVAALRSVDTDAALPELVDVEALLESLKPSENTFDKLPIEHIFMENQYFRVMSQPAGTLVVGKKHRRKTANALLNGEMLVYTKESCKPIHLKAGDVFESGPGVRKVLVAITDCRFANIHVTSETDLDVIEKTFIHTESQEMLEHDIRQIVNAGDTKCLG